MQYKYTCYINDIEVDFLTFLKELADSKITPNQMADVMDGFEYIGKYKMIFKLKIIDD